MGPEKFGELIGEQFSGASDESLRAVADAVIRNDRSAYQTATLDVMTQSSSIRLDNVDNTVVNGDTATADTTVIYAVGSQPPQTEESQACTSPDQA